MGESGQVSSTNPFKIGNFIVEKEGVRGLYKGIDSALFRQATYATTRLGIYRTLYNKKL
jgi:solute carrier family 25 oxoglutarate transporter 11